MTDLLIQTLGLLALLSAIGGGYWYWVRPRQADRQGKGLLLLLILTMAGGLIGSTGWWFDDPRSFSWDLPPLASRMLAAAGWAFGAVTFMVLQRPVRRTLRLALLMLAVYLGPLAIAIVLFHLDRFDFAAPITVGFFMIVTLMLAPTIWFLIRQPGILSGAPADLAPAHTTVRAWLLLVAVVTGLWGLALFITDSGPVDLIWVWPGDLLTSRLIAVMLLTVAVGAAASHRYANDSRLVLVVITVYGFGVTLANLWNMAGGRPVNSAYLVAFGLMCLISAGLLFQERRALAGQWQRALN